MTEVEAKELLIDEDTFLTCGVHIGTKQKSKDMEPYVYKVRDDGLRILNVNMTSEKVVEAVKRAGGPVSELGISGGCVPSEVTFKFVALEPTGVSNDPYPLLSP